jgi:hypothetical protein
MSRRRGLDVIRCKLRRGTDERTTCVRTDGSGKVGERQVCRGIRKRVAAGKEKRRDVLKERREITRRRRGRT